MYQPCFQVSVLPNSTQWKGTTTTPTTPARTTWGVTDKSIIRQKTIRCSVTAPDRAVVAAKGPKLRAPYRHFLHVDDLSGEELRYVLKEARCMKEADLLNDDNFKPLKGKAMSMLFAKPSARTRVSFETAMYKAGGHALCLGPEVGVNSRESAKDISRVLSGMTDMIMARLFAHEDIVQVAEVANVPVINGLTDYNHPCQILADVLTMMECKKNDNIEGTKIVYVGDGNNIVHSWFEFAARIGINFICCCPKGYEPDEKLFQRVKHTGISDISISHEPKDAVRGADFIYSDVWASMGQKEQVAQRELDFKPFQISNELIKETGNANTKFMHCLPAERGRECTDEVMEADYSVVFEQAENRMHAQLAIMLSCMGWPSSSS